IVSDTLRYDAAGRVFAGTATGASGWGPLDLRLTYSGLGAVAYATGMTPGTSPYEAFRTDAIGNRLWRGDYNWDPNYQTRVRRQGYDEYAREVADTLVQAQIQMYQYRFYTDYDPDG